MTLPGTLSLEKAGPREKIKPRIPQPKPLQTPIPFEPLETDIPEITLGGEVSFADVGVGEAMREQMELLPSPDEVVAVVGHLEVKDLQEFACAIMDTAVRAALDGVLSIDSVRLLNSWFGSMEETVAAGDSIDEILSRRDDHEAFEAI